MSDDAPGQRPLAAIDDRTAKSSSSGRATSACRSRCGRPSSASPSSATTPSPTRIDALAERHARTSRTSPTSSSQSALDARLPADPRPARPPRLRRRRDHRADAAARRHPDLSLHRGRRPRPRATRSSAGALVVLESTTYPGTTEELLRPILEESGLRAGVDFFLGYSPERIDPGNPTWNLVNTPKVVSGIDAASLPRVEAFYGALVDKVVPVGSTAEAELVKLLENTFRHVNIALVNELAMFAGDLGVDIWTAIDAASTKPFGFMRFTPGPGVGGHCLPIDPSYLAWRVRAAARPHVPVRRARQRRQRAHARLRRHARRSCSSTEHGPVREGQPHPAPRARLQGGHLRLARVAVDARSPSGCSRSAPTCAGTTRTSRQAVDLGLDVPRGRLRRRRARRPPTSWSCSSTTPTCPTSRSPGRPPRPRHQGPPAQGAVHRRDALSSSAQPYRSRGSPPETRSSSASAKNFAAQLR